MTDVEPVQQAATLTIEQALHQAIAYHQAGQLADAERLYRAILQSQPNHPDANHNLGVLAVQVNQPAAGLPHFEVALKASPTQGQYWFSYIDALLQAGRVDAAKEALVLAQQSGLQSDAVEALAVRLPSDAAEIQPALQDVLPVSSQAPQIDSKNTNAKTTKSNPTAGQFAPAKGKNPSTKEISKLEVLLNGARYAEAAVFAQALTMQFPLNGYVWKALGVAFSRMGRNADALKSMQQAAALSPSDAEVHFNLGNTLKDFGRLAEAETCYRRALQIKPGFVEAHSNLGVVLLALGRLDEAEASYRRALQIKPSYAEAHSNLGIVLSEQGRLDEAVASCRRALQIKPAYAQANYNLANALNDLGRLNEAEAGYLRALQIKPDFTEAHSNLGRALNAMGRLEEAVVCYRQALQFKADFAEAHNDLANTLKALGRPDEAVTSYRQALQFKTDFAEAHINLGDTLTIYGRPDESIAHFEQALFINSKLDMAKFGLCNALYAISLVDRDKAKQLASRARTLFPEDQIILRGISGILGQTNIAVDEALYTRDLFDKFAATFESTLEKLKYNTPRLIADELGIEAGLTNNDLDVLDAGCGTGLSGICLKPAARTLVGVDLSAEMLRLAAEKNIYDGLYEDNIVDFMKKGQAAFDLIVLADVLVYIGDVEELVKSMSFALRHNGRIAISAECMKDDATDEKFALQSSGRYQHSIGYLRQSIEDAGFSLNKVTSCTLREEHEEPVAGWIVIATKL